MIQRIADSGFIIAWNSADKRERNWARGEMRKWGGPFLTCEGALIEAAHFLPPPLVARAVQDGSFEVAFDLAEQIQAVEGLLQKYSDRDMDFTDACIVRMAELYPNCVVFTVDHDFDVYRRFKDQPIPTNYPPED
jgi:uncharacterized protein